MGQVCAKHTQYYEERCPYCEEPEIVNPNDAYLESLRAALWAGGQRLHADTPPNDGHGAFE